MQKEGRVGSIFLVVSGLSGSSVDYFFHGFTYFSALKHNSNLYPPPQQNPHIATSIHPLAMYGVQHIILSLRSIACLVGRDHGNQALEQSMDLSACWDCLAYSGDVLQYTLLAPQSGLGGFP